MPVKKVTKKPVKKVSPKKTVKKTTKKAVTAKAPKKTVKKAKKPQVSKKSTKDVAVSPVVDSSGVVTMSPVPDDVVNT